jgi:hypothetical protein
MGELYKQLRYAWRHFHWRNLRKVTHSKVVQSTALFPFVGYFALNEGAKNLLTLPEGIPTLLEPNSKLFLVYFGLLLIGGGVVIYNLRCPYLIKYFEDENKCAEFYMKMASFGQVYAMLIALFGLQTPNPIHREIENRYDEFSRNPEAWEKFVSSRPREFFGFYVGFYSSQDNDRPASRAICAALLALGFLCLSVPSIETFVAVGRTLLRIS